MMPREISASELADALDDLNEAEVTVAKALLELVRTDRHKGIEMATMFMPRILAAQRDHEAALLAIFDELARIKDPK